MARQGRGARGQGRWTALGGQGHHRLEKLEAEVARVAAAYELTRQEIASLKAAILPRLDHQDQCVDDLKARVQNLESRLLGKGAIILLVVEAMFYALGHK